MAREQFNPDIDGRRSASRYVNEVEAIDKRRRLAEAEEMQELKRQAAETKKEAERIAKRTVREQVEREPIGHELKNAGVALGVIGAGIGAIALSVVSVAAESSRVSAAERAKDELRDTYREALEISCAEQGVDPNRTLADYKEEVKGYNKERSEAYKEFDEIEKKSLSNIEQAQKDYNKEAARISTEEKHVDRVLKNKTQEAESNYNSEVERIKANLPESEHKSAIKEAESRRDATIQAATESHDKSISDLIDRHTKADDAMRRTVDAEKQNISEAQRALKAKVDPITSELTNAELRQAKYEVAAKEAQSLTGFNGDRSARPSTGDFVRAVNSTHASVGHTLASVFGSDAEKSLLSKVDADKAAQKAAQQNGEKYVSSITRDEASRARAIEQKYAGNISDEKNIARTANSLRESVRSLEARLGALPGEVEKVKRQIKDTNAEIRQVEARINTIKADKEALQTGKNKDGTSLSAEQIKTIEQRLKSSTASDVLANKLAGLKQQSANLSKLQNKLEKQIPETQNAINQVNVHIGMLSRNKMAIAQTRVTSVPFRTRAAAGLGFASGRLVGRASDKMSGSKHMAVRGLGKISGAASRKMIMSAEEKAGGKSQGNKSKKLNAKAERRISKSLQPIQRELNKSLHKGNEIHENLMRDFGKMGRVAQKYEMALKVGGMALMVLKLPAGLGIKCGKQAFRHIGGHTRLGRKIALRRAKFQNSRLGSFTKIAGNKLKVGSKKMVRGVLRAPVKILQAPRNIMGALTDPTVIIKKAALAGVRVTRKTAGIAFKGTRTGLRVGKRAVGAGVRVGKKVGKKAFNKTIGKTKTYGKYKAAKKKTSEWKNKVAERFKNSRIFRALSGVAGGIRTLFSGAQALKRKIIAALLSLIGALVSAIITVIGFVLIAGIVALIVMILVIAALGLLTSIVNAISGWIANISAPEKELVKNNPEYIISHAVNYRNAETEIMDFFRESSDNPSNLSVSIDPVFYGITDTKIKKADRKEFMNDSDGNGYFDEYGAYNYGAVDTYKNLVRNIQKEISSSKKIEISEDKRTLALDEAKFDLSKAKYGRVSFNYYGDAEIEKNTEGNAIKDDNGNFILKSDAQASRYEISNAKDAWALVDALYTKKSKDMQKLEVMSYLGVGDFQMSKFEPGSDRAANNLFWGTHNIKYNEGSSADDVWYHVTTDTGEVDSTKRYIRQEDDSYTVGEVKNYLCDESHQKTKEIKYTEIEKTQVQKRPHATQSDYEAALSNGKYCPYISVKKITQYQTDDLWATECFYSNGNGGGVSAAGFIYDNGHLNKYHSSPNSDTIYFTRINGSSKYYVTNGNGICIGTEEPSWVVPLFANGMCNARPDYMTNFSVEWDAYSNSYKFTFYAYNNSSPNDWLRCNFSIIEATSDMNYSQCSCDWVVDTTETRTEHTIEYHYCTGHIDLDASMVVLNAADENGKTNESFFSAAREVQGLDHEETDTGFLGILSSGTQAEVDGWGKVGVGFTSYKPYKPAEDFAKNSDLVSLTVFKMKTDNIYHHDGDDSKIKDLSIDHSWYQNDGTQTTTSFKPIIKHENELLFGFMFNDHIYYSQYFISGKQENIDKKCKVYEYTQGGDGSTSMTSVRPGFGFSAGSSPAGNSYYHVTWSHE